MAGENEVIAVAQSYLYLIITGVVILLVGLGLGILVKKLIYKLLSEIELNKIMNRVGITYNLEKWISSSISYIIYLATIIITLDHFSVGSIVLYIILGAILMLVVLTFLVGLKDIVPNFIGWIYLQKKKSVREGHKIDIREIEGEVEKVGFLETEIKTEKGDILYIPNSLFLKSKFKLKKHKD